MAQRITDMTGAKVKAAIEGLQIPQAVKDALGWDLIAVVGAESFRFILVITCPIPGQPDHALYIDVRQAFDPYATQAEINALVRSYVHEAQAGADQLASKQNGHKTSPGGLVIPP